MIAFIMAAALTAFDLSCKALYTTNESGVLPKKVTGEFGPFFKVDLVAGRYCEGTCSETHAIAKVTATELFLKVLDTASEKQYLRVSRESGDYVSKIQFGDAELTTTGTCQAKTFTGFPARKF